MGRSKQWQWLEENGYTQGDSQLLEKGKVLWKKKYHREYQKSRRQKMKYLTVSLHPDETRQLEASAKTHHRSLTTYIREASLAYTGKIYLVPDEELITDLRQEIALIRYNLEDIRELIATSYGEDQRKQMDLVIDRITYLDQYVRTLLEQPSLASNSH